MGATGSLVRLYLCFSHSFFFGTVFGAICLPALITQENRKKFTLLLFNLLVIVFRLFLEIQVEIHKKSRWFFSPFSRGSLVFYHHFMQLVVSMTLNNLLRRNRKIWGQVLGKILLDTEIGILNQLLLLLIFMFGVEYVDNRNTGGFVWIGYYLK